MIYIVKQGTFDFFKINIMLFKKKHSVYVLSQESS